MPRLFGFALVFILFCVPLAAQNSASAGNAGVAGDVDPVSLIGMTLDELLRFYGTPRSVYAVRGLEEWQDDVVFVYDHGDYYIYRDRVWQAGIKTARGIRIGDSRSVVSLVLGEEAEFRMNSALVFLDSGNWPLMFRYDFDSVGRVYAIYIYRTDF